MARVHRYRSVATAQIGLPSHVLREKAERRELARDFEANQPDCAMGSVMSRTTMDKQRDHSFGHHLRLALLIAITAGSVPASAASFDCNRARLPDEKAICASRQLSELDVEMSVRYQMLTGLVAMGTRGDMGDEQQSWLSARKKCGANQACLLGAYRSRIQTLKDEYAHLASRGPF